MSRDSILELHCFSLHQSDVMTDSLTAFQNIITSNGLISLFNYKITMQNYSGGLIHLKRTIFSQLIICGTYS